MDGPKRHLLDAAPIQWDGPWTEWRQPTTTPEGSTPRPRCGLQAGIPPLNAKGMAVGRERHAAEAKDSTPT